ncbi:hypothetical protein ONZ43_g3755 [Nemania bipapillata]|uniref:Uncharacterized protein n=1 Tax=Nemania bipapillata TaxID=110536 RepID=A0ACC2IVR7_9PEZI|nr:hypothetical protein ONZ43_g3755 [Nemania bipapillata]
MAADQSNDQTTIYGTQQTNLATGNDKESGHRNPNNGQKAPNTDGVTDTTSAGQDRHNKIMAAILTRFRNIVMAATEPLPKSAAIAQASLNTMTMNNEVSALIKEIENLLVLTREIKTLWIVGPLRKPGDASEKIREKELDENAAKVSKLYDTLVELEAENARRRNPAQQPIVATKDEQRTEVKTENNNARVKHEEQVFIVGIWGCKRPLIFVLRKASLTFLAAPDLSLVAKFVL